MIDMSVVLNNPDLCQPFTAMRSTDGTFVNGIYQDTKTSVALYGSVQTPDANTLEQMPEGDRVTGSRVFWSTSPIYETRDGNTQGVSDILIHRDVQYRVAKVWNWSDYGFFKAFAVRIKGA